MLWPSIRRWKFQRSRIGKLPASAWCLNSVCSATTQRCWPSSTAPSSSSVPPLLGPQLRRLDLRASQSTMRPSIANSSASKAPIAAVSSVIASRIRPRRPSVQAQRKAKKPRGGGAGAASGYGCTSFSNQANTLPFLTGQTREVSRYLITHSGMGLREARAT